MVGCGKRPRNRIYIVSKRRQITGGKIVNAQKTYEKLLRRADHEGMTAWLVDAFAKAENRLRGMGLGKLIKAK